ncbi:glycosyl transferase family 1 [Anaerobacillus alkalilacustris]|uniref:Glycosyl transferase family 1 n=1 Tax=Anaerobacillus alkalilacustris TaxID=393763 RepID=A0A1S2LE98_9BACI|nr:glycosyltransferase [Anaerobacillus alkalilacustris]OIJ10393.1 glycosyl transferase family 1 [Anaerobacillus alkalilacustris]
MKNKVKILILIKKFGLKFPKHKQKYEMIKALEEFADVYYWHNDGSIIEILKKFKFTPDFILHYDFAWNGHYAPKISDLDKINIPKGCFVIDIHWNKEKRRNYFITNNIDLIFSVTKHPFLHAFPEFKEKHRWIPFSINPNVIKDWKLKKDIKFLLMGLVHYNNVKHPPKGRYRFRDAVYEKMKSIEGFKFNKHPGHLTSSTKMVNENFAKELNRSEIFFTCGGVFQYPVIKFFEALGCKTLLLAEPNPDILELGFKDGENFVACNISNFYKKALYYSENKIERERIINNGYNFVHTHHTNKVRAKNFVQYIEEFLADKKST